MFRLLTLAALVVLTASPALTQTCTTSWAAAQNGSWSDHANWTDGAPDAGDTACITESGTYTVTLDRDQPLAGLVVGGTSGQQTLRLDRSLSTLGEGTIAGNGVLELESCGTFCGGLFGVTGTLAVEGTLVHRNGSALLSQGGTVDIAPGGTLRVRTGINSVTMGSGTAGARSRLVVQGTLLFDAEGQTPRSATLYGDLDLVGGTLAVTDGRVDFQSQGRWTGGTFDVPEGGDLWFRGGNGSDGVYEVSGTLSGTPAGQVQFSSNATLTAAASGATLDVGGAGIEVSPGSGQTTYFRSSGGAFTNTGRIVVRGNGLWLNDASLRNEGQVDVLTTLRMEEDARIENAASGTVSLIDAGSLRGGSDGGQLTGGGRIVAAGAARRSSITVPVDLDGATVEVTAERLQFSGGALRDVSFDVAEASSIWFTSSNGEGLDGVFEVGGTLSGDIEGDLLLSSGGTLAAASGGATLDLEGTGLIVFPGSGQTAFFTSAGGALTNTGVVTVVGNGLWISQVIARNQGTVNVQTTVNLINGGTLTNEAGGTVDFQGPGRTNSTDDTGRFVNEGLVVSSGSGRSSLEELRAQPGSELRVLEGADVQLFPPGAASIPAGAALTGTGRITNFSQQLLIEGDVSPGTEDAPIGTLTYGFWTFFASATGVARLVIDVDENGSDLLETVRGGGPSGSVQLGGTLLIRVADGYTPQPGDTFTVLRTTNTSNDIVGEFDLVVAQGAPEGIGFVIERNADNTEVIVRAVEVAPGGPIRVSASSVVGGGERRLFLTGPGVADVAAARLECTSCLDDQAAGTIEATVGGDAALGLVVFDLTSPRAFGFYDLVLSRTALPDTTLPFTVRPFLSLALIRESVLSGAGVRLDKGNPSYFQLLVNGNSPFASYPFYAFDYPEPRVEWSVDSGRRLVETGGRIFEDDEAGRDLTYFLTGVTPDRPISVLLAQRLDPDDVLFPEQEPTGPDDDRVPFGEGFTIRYASSNNVSLERMAGAVEAGIRATPSLTAFLSDVDADDPNAVSDATLNVLRSKFDYIAAPSEALTLILGELGASTGLIEAAESEFFDALDAAGGTLLSEIGQATSDAVIAAPANVRDLFLDEVAELAGRFGDEARDALLPAPAAKQQGRTVTGTTGNIPIPPSPFGGSCGAFGNAGTSLTGNNINAAGGMSSGSSGGSSGGGAGSGACGPYDPNDKTTSTPYLCEFGTVEVDGEEVPRCVRYYVPLENAQDVIPYQIAFENQAQATAPAEFVTITDVLDPSLDPNTLEVYGTSSDSTFTYTVEGQRVTFRFTGIDLPPNVDPPEGEGFVSFGVRPRAGLAPGTEITNEAGIVFDFNPPIETPPVIHELRETADLGLALNAPEQVEEDDPFTFEVIAAHIIGDPVAEATLTISAGTPIASASPTEGICSGQGTPIVTCTLADLDAGDGITVAVELDDPPRGTYTLASSIAFSGFDAYAANDSDDMTVGVVGVGVEDDADGFPREVRLAGVAPNPVRSTTTLRWGVPTATAVDLRIYDLRGREVAVLAEGERAAPGWHETTWRPNLASGVYLVRLMAGAEVRTRKLVVMR